MNELNTQEEIVDRGEQVQRLLYRILPFWPLIVLAVILGFIGARVYLRYQLPVYSAKARVIVNDQTEQKSANLQEILKIDTRNLSTETEKEMQILSSRDLLAKLTQKLQLNIHYIQKGRVRTARFDQNDLPVILELRNPDTIKKPVFLQAEIIDNKTVKFDEILFPIDSFVNTALGEMRWKKNGTVQTATSSKFFVSIVPITNEVASLKAALKIEPISKQSSILDLTFVDVIPERATSILSELFELYGSTTIDYKSRIYQNSQRFLDERLRLVADELSGVEKSMQDLRARENIIDLGAEGTLYLSEVKITDGKIAEIDIQLEILDKVNNYVSRRNNTGDSIPATLGITDPVLINLLSQLYQAETELQRTKELSGNKNPQIDVYEDVIKKLKPGILNSINNLRVNLLASKKRLEQENERMSGILTKIPKKERMLLDVSRQQEIKNAIYTFLLQKREEAAIAAASIVPNFRVIETPEKGDIVSPIPKKIYSVGIITALCLVIVFIYFKEFSSKKILFRSQVEEYLPIPVISELVYFEHNPNDPVVVGDGKRTLIAEQFRELRTNINFITATSPDPCKIILTTSSIPGEGKSFVAINAAISLSLTSSRVVLLEFDMRKPKISKPIGIAADPGLSNFLAGSVKEEDIVKKHPSIENLFVIPSGPIPPNPAELMTNEKLSILFSYLKVNFDYVVIDSPPIAAVTDAKILSPFADATLYIVRHNYTNYVFLNLLSDVHRKKALKNINIVFNGIKNKKVLGYGYSSYGYGYGYGYSYGYGYTVDEKRKKGLLSKLASLFKFKSKKGRT